MASLYNIGLTGLNAAKAGLVTTSHNIANISTEGYNRQSIVQTNQTPVYSGSGFFGQGTNVITVQRSYNSYLDKQILSSESQQNAFQAYQFQIEQINNMMADSDTGLSPGMQTFFDGIQAVAANPSSISARQSLLSSAQTLVDRFNTLDQRLGDMRTAVESQIGDVVKQVNSITREIASLNTQIRTVQAGGDKQPANDLLDNRDRLVSSLNKLVQIRVTPESDGSVNIFAGSGQALVVGPEVSTMVITPDKADARRGAIGLQNADGSFLPVPERLLTGGQLGGLLEFRRDALDTVQNQLGLIATGIVDKVNTQHKLGQDLDGVMGKDFFREIVPTVLRNGQAATNIDVRFADSSKLTGDEYQLRFTDNAGSFELTRTSDNQLVQAADVGLKITPSLPTTPGDVFNILPTRNSASRMQLAITDVRAVAAGTPVTLEAATTNAGSAQVAGIKLTSVTGINYATPHIGAYDLIFDSANNRYNVMSGGVSIGSVAYNPVTDYAGVERTLPGALSSINITINGTPIDGDRLRLRSNPDTTSDNRNAVLLGNLQSDRTMLVRRTSGGSPITGEAANSATFQSVYAQLVNAIGNKTRDAQVGAEVQGQLRDEANTARSSSSGVNLDEEAANLIRYQQAYQASGRVMAVASQLFDEILSIAR